MNVNENCQTVLASIMVGLLVAVGSIGASAASTNGTGASDTAILAKCDSAGSECLLARLIEIRRIASTLRHSHQKAIELANEELLRAYVHSKMFAQVNRSPNRYRNCGAIDALSCLRSYKVVYSGTKQVAPQGESYAVGCLGLFEPGGRESIKFYFVREDGVFKMSSYGVMYGLPNLDRPAEMEKQCWQDITSS